jgi:predicted dehydrogenase
VTASYRVGVVGLGQVGLTYGRPDEPYPYCHVGGVLHCDRTTLSAVVDRAPAAVGRFTSDWGRLAPDTATFSTVADLLGHEVPDIVAVCVREPDRHADLNLLLEAKPRAVFLEKPASCSLGEMDEIMTKCRSNGTLLTVSYSRHWTPHVVGLQRLVQDGLIGRVHTIVGYSPGERLLSFACHTIDLICQFAGYQPRRVTATSGPGPYCDDMPPPGYRPEPSYEQISIEFDNGVLGTIHGHAGPHEYWYCDVVGTDGLVRAGQYVAPAAFRPDGEPIALAADSLPPDAGVFTEAYTAIATALDGGAPPACSGNDAATVNEIGFAAVESILSGAPVELPLRHRDLRIFANG